MSLLFEMERYEWNTFKDSQNRLLSDIIDKKVKRRHRIHRKKSPKYRKKDVYRMSNVRKWISNDIGTQMDFYNQSLPVTSGNTNIDTDYYPYSLSEVLTDNAIADITTDNSDTRMRCKLRLTVETITDSQLERLSLAIQPLPKYKSSPIIFRCKPTPAYEITKVAGMKWGFPCLVTKVNKKLITGKAMGLGRLVSQCWQCCVPPIVNNAPNCKRYQRKRGRDCDYQYYSLYSLLAELCNQWRTKIQMCSDIASIISQFIGYTMRSQCASFDCGMVSLTSFQYNLILKRFEQFRPYLEVDIPCGNYSIPDKQLYNGIIFFEGT